MKDRLEKEMTRWYTSRVVKAKLQRFTLNTKNRYSKPKNESSDFSISSFSLYQ